MVTEVIMQREILGDFVGQKSKSMGKQEYSKWVVGNTCGCILCYL